ncbi:class III lanthipeptide [Chengkuizengella sp. SCS-71B]
MNQVLALQQLESKKDSEINRMISPVAATTGVDIWTNLIIGK